VLHLIESALRKCDRHGLRTPSLISKTGLYRSHSHLPLWSSALQVGVLSSGLKSLALLTAGTKRILRVVFCNALLNITWLQPNLIVNVTGINQLAFQKLMPKLAKAWAGRARRAILHYARNR
jgi:hypothetical protein